MKAQQNITTVHTHNSNEIARQIRNRIERGHGIMTVFLRKDGRIRIFREDLLIDDSAVGVVGHFGRRHTIEFIEKQFKQFMEKLPGDYLES